MSDPVDEMVALGTAMGQAGIYWRQMAERMERERDAAITERDRLAIANAILRAVVLKQEYLGWQDEFRFWHCQLCGGVGDQAVLAEPDLGTVKHEPSCILAHPADARGAAILEAADAMASTLEAAANAVERRCLVQHSGCISEGAIVRTMRERSVAYRALAAHAAPSGEG